MVRRELVLRGDGNHHETVEAQEAVAGRVRFHPRTSQRFSFAVVVPRDLPCPCSETAHIDREPRPDYSVE